MLNPRRVNLAVLVCAGLFISPTVSRAQDPRLFPANTELVVTFNIKQILGSELVKSKPEAIKQIKAALENPPFNEVMKHLKEMGFDPFTDLISITVAHPGTVTKDPKDVFVVIDGIFNAAKVADAAKKAAKDFGDIVKISNFGTTPIYEVKPQMGDKFYVALVDKSLVVTANEDVLKGAITRAQGNAVVATKVKDLLKNVNDKQSFNGVITGDAMLRIAKETKGADLLLPQAAEALKSIQGVAGSVTITKEIDFQLGVGAKDEMTAQKIAGLGQLTLFTLQLIVAKEAKQDANFIPIMEVVNTLKVTAAGTTTTLTGKVSRENLEKILKSFGNQLFNFPPPKLNLSPAPTVLRPGN